VPCKKAYRSPETAAAGGVDRLSQKPQRQLSFEGFTGKVISRPPQREQLVMIQDNGCVSTWLGILATSCASDYRGARRISQLTSVSSRPPQREQLVIIQDNGCVSTWLGHSRDILCIRLQRGKAISQLTSVIRLNPAIRDQVKSGHREWPKT
jgi:hypothetical protein